MSKIQIMDDILANKIAAGEVVEKCASVVKELVENSIDAKAKEIKIDLIEAGTKQIKVTDDGIGMDKQDATLCFSRHATSKLMNEQQLYHINTLGFRGEALASIASVSEVTLKTCQNNIGTLVKIEGGKLININTCDARKGTTITIDNLFYNTPARLKHMKSLYTELSNITDYVNKIALSNPDIKFILTNNNSVLLNTSGDNNLLKTISNVFGVNTVRKMIPINGENGDYKIDGYITLPEIHRSNRNGIITLVNKRVVRNADLNRTINDSYHSYKPDNRYPIVVINIEVDPSLVDVNVHPTKMDIKFSKMDTLTELINKLIKDTLKKKELIPKVETNEKTEELETEENYSQPAIDYSKKISDLEDIYLIDDFVKQVDSPLFKEIETKEKIVKNNLPELYPIGLVHGTYIICQNNRGMTLIDQHAAKERVNYETYKYKLGHPKKESIQLLIPFNIEFTNNEFIILKQHFDILEQIGYDISEFGVNSILIKAHPTWLPKGYEKEATLKVLESIIAYEKKFDIEKFNESLAISLSCKMSIKANTNLSLLEMENLISDLRKCDNPYNCPHGRPTMIEYTKSELEKLFKRSGF